PKTTTTNPRKTNRTPIGVSVRTKSPHRAGTPNSFAIKSTSVENAAAAKDIRPGMTTVNLPLDSSTLQRIGGGCRALLFCAWLEGRRSWSVSAVRSGLTVRSWSVVISVRGRRRKRERNSACLRASSKCVGEEIAVSFPLMVLSLTGYQSAESETNSKAMMTALKSLRLRSRFFMGIRRPYCRIESRRPVSSINQRRPNTSAPPMPRNTGLICPSTRRFDSDAFSVGTTPAAPRGRKIRARKNGTKDGQASSSLLHFDRGGGRPPERPRWGRQRLALGAGSHKRPRIPRLEHPLMRHTHATGWDPRQVGVPEETACNDAARNGKAVSHKVEMSSI